MSDISHFFKPVETKEDLEPDSGTFSNIIKSYKGDNFPDLEDLDIAFFGVLEDRSAVSNSGSAAAPNVIRNCLQGLYPTGFNPKIADLGNIEPGHTVKDTYFAVSAVVEYLVKKNIVPIILGGSQDLSFAQFLGYQNLEQTINVCSIDSTFDLGIANENLNNRSFLGKIILHQPNFLFNYSVLGYQSYLVSQNGLEMMEKLYFDTYRLGQVRHNVSESEPIIRHADMLTFDFSSVRYSDAPGTEHASPNGFYAEEACQMMRYAGMNDKITSLGLYELNPNFDKRGKTAALAAQMIWCFLEGYYQRKKDYPSRSNPDYTRFHVFLENNRYEINFFRSLKTDRWWMEVPYPPDKNIRFERHTLIPCSVKDYEMACKDEIPDRWWQTYQKLF